MNVSPAPGPILIVAPHQDDAALSCSALLDAGGPVDVLTVFTGLPETPRQGWWDLDCGFAGSHESVPLRNDEERRALEPSVRHLELLGLLEAQHLVGERPEADRARLAEWVADWSEREGPAATVAVPVGAGWRPGLVRSQLVRAGLARNPGARPSPGHLYVRDAVLDALAGKAVRILAYEELPYLWGGRGDAEARRIAKARGLHATPYMVEVDRAAKAERIAVYASQVPHISPSDGRLDDPSVLPAEERYWQLGTSVVR